MDERTDEELLSAYELGEEKAFAELVRRYLQTIFSFTYRLTGDEQEAEDITQDVFVKIWKHAKNYNKNSSRFKTWVLHIARNTTIDFLRKRKHAVFSQFDDNEGNNSILDTAVDESKRPDELFAEEEDRAMLEEAVVKLSPKHREILVLHYTNHLTFEEISEVLEEPSNTVKSRHHRALIALRKNMAENAPKLLE